MSTSEPPPTPPPVPPGPPPPPPYEATAPAATHEWRSLGGLATALTWLFGINVIVTVGLTGALVARVGTLSDLVDHGLRPDLLLEDEDARELVVTMLGVFGVVSLAIVVCFIMWFFRAAKNNEVLGRTRPRFGPGWAIGGWFIPLANFVIPVLIAQDLWRGSDPSVPRGDDRWKIGSRSALVGWWWATFVLGRFSFFIGSGEVENVAADLRRSAYGAIVGQLLTIAAAILAILVVRRITERQEECLRVQQGQTAPPPPPA
jgi:hypothetical protein